MFMSMLNRQVYLKVKKKLLKAKTTMYRKA